MSCSVLQPYSYYAVLLGFSWRVALLQACHTTCGDMGHSLLAGLFTWWVLQNAPDRGQVSKVVAVEPMPQNVAVMQANLQQHGLSSQVMVAWSSITNDPGGFCA